MWPVVFAWTGNGYSEASREYKNYYEQHLRDLDRQLAAEPAEWAQADLAPAAEPSISLVPGVSFGAPVNSLNDSTSKTGPANIPAAAALPPAAANPDSGNQTDYYCLRLDKAKTEGFLGIHSDVTMTYAIKNSESNDRDDRELAAYLLSYIGTPESTSDLKRLAADADSAVAEVAKERLSPVDSEPSGNYGISEQATNLPGR